MFLSLNCLSNSERGPTSLSMHNVQANHPLLNDGQAKQSLILISLSLSLSLSLFRQPQFISHFHYLRHVRTFCLLTFFHGCMMKPFAMIFIPFSLLRMENKRYPLLLPGRNVFVMSPQCSLTTRPRVGLIPSSVLLSASQLRDRNANNTFCMVQENCSVF